CIIAPATRDIGVTISVKRIGPTLQFSTRHRPVPGLYRPRRQRPGITAATETIRKKHIWSRRDHKGDRRCVSVSDAVVYFVSEAIHAAVICSGHIIEAAVIAQIQ